MLRIFVREREGGITYDMLDEVSGYDFVLDDSRILLANVDSFETNDPSWKFGYQETVTSCVAGPEDRGLFLYRRAPYGTSESYYTIGGQRVWMKLRWNSVVYDANDEVYDFILYLTDIGYKSADIAGMHCVLYDYVGVGYQALNFCGKGFSPDLSNGARVGTKLTATFSVVKHGTNELASGKVLYGFMDLDVGGFHGYDVMTMDDYVESVQVLSDTLSPIYVRPDTTLHVKVSERQFLGTGINDNSLTAVQQSGISFLGNASGTTIHWRGVGCGTRVVLDIDSFTTKYQIIPSKDGPGTITPETVVTAFKGQNKAFVMKADEYAHITEVKVDGVAQTVTNPKEMTYLFENVRADHTIYVKFEPDTYVVNTYVRWRKADGSWEAYTKADSATVNGGTDYSYIWVRNELRDEPVNVYYDADPKTVSANTITANQTFYLDVERKQYGYTFDYNPPEGYAVIGIANKQDDLLDKWAETVSGNVKSPSLTGYTFLGWNTKRDGTGNAYVSEPMLSNKTFYAQWRKNKYKVRYDANGSSNPSHETGELTQNTVTGVMADSDYEYDTRGTLRTNAFVRKGYTFLGWNTKVDGTGLAYGESAYDISNKLYSDGYSNVYNMTSTDGAVLTLYAQWKKQLGTEVLTVVSEETGNPIPGVQLKLYQKVNGIWKERTDIGVVTTDRNGQVNVRDLHWFPYEWRSVSVPDGYQGMTNVSFGIDYDHLSLTHTRILYLKRVTIVLDSVVDAIISGERGPSFLYHVTGTDAAGVSHTYEVLVDVDSTSKTGQSVLSGIYAGQYNIRQEAVSRYIPGLSQNVLHSTSVGIHGTCDVLHYDRAELKFPYTLEQYEGFGSMDNVGNSFGANHSVKIRSLYELFLK